MTTNKVSLKERLATTAAKRDSAMSTNMNAAKEAYTDRDKEVAAAPLKAPPKPLPKVTLYADAKVLKAIRQVAVDDGVQVQEILRAAVREYLATRGHHFQDLTTGE